MQGRKWSCVRETWVTAQEANGKYVIGQVYPIGKHVKIITGTSVIMEQGNLRFAGEESITPSEENMEKRELEGLN